MQAGSLLPEISYPLAPGSVTHSASLQPCWVDGREKGERASGSWLSQKLTWPHPRFLELFVDKAHLVQTTLNLLDAVGRKWEDSNITRIGTGGSCLSATEQGGV